MKEEKKCEETLKLLQTKPRKENINSCRNITTEELSLWYVKLLSKWLFTHSVLYISHNLKAIVSGKS